MIHAEQATEQSRLARIKSFEAANPEFVALLEKEIAKCMDAGETELTIFPTENAAIPAGARHYLWAYGYMVGEHIEAGSKTPSLFISW